MDEKSCINGESHNYQVTLSEIKNTDSWRTDKEVSVVRQMTCTKCGGRIQPNPSSK